MIVYCVRHGESEANKDVSVYLEKLDHEIELSDLGKDQSIKAGEHILKEENDEDLLLLGTPNRYVFFSSPYKRAKQTTDKIIAGMSGNVAGKEIKQRIKVYHSPVIREQEYKVFEDSEDAETKKKEMIRFGKYWYRFKNAESMADVYGRAMSFYNYLVNKINSGALDKDRDVIVIVSHNEFLKNFKGICEGYCNEDIRDMKIENAKPFKVDLFEKL